MNRHRKTAYWVAGIAGAATLAGTMTLLLPALIWLLVGVGAGTTSYGATRLAQENRVLRRRRK